MLQKRSYAVEDPECLPDLVLRVVLRELPAHEGQEVGEHDIAGRVRVDLVHHVLKTSTVLSPDYSYLSLLRQLNYFYTKNRVLCNLNVSLTLHYTQDSNFS